MIWFVIKILFCVLVVLKFLVSFTNARCRSKVCLVGKTALITGGNSGLGLELAKQFASRGCAIIIADKDDATSTVNRLIQETHNPNISSKLVDFASFKSVRSFAQEFTKSVEKLHILVNNAGVADVSFEMTEDGIQKIMQINYFSHFLLTHLLLGLLLKSTPSRIIYTSSLGAYVANFFATDLKGLPPSDMEIFTSGSYGNSKLAGAVMSRVLARELKHTGVTSNAFHPGFVKTNIWNTVRQRKEINLRLWLAWNYIFGKNLDEGVQTPLYLACADEVNRVSGQMFMECSPVWQPIKVYDMDLCKKVWKLSEDCVNLRHEEKLNVILDQWQTKS